MLLPLGYRRGSARVLCCCGSGAGVGLAQVSEQSVFALKCGAAEAAAACARFLYGSDGAACLQSLCSLAVWQLQARSDRINAKKGHKKQAHGELNQTI